MTDAPLAQLLATADAAALLGVKPQTLRKWRLNGNGPRYVRLGTGGHGRVAYRPEDVRHWLDARAFSRTAEESAAAQCRS